MDSKATLSLILALTAPSVFALGNTLFDDVGPNTGVSVPIAVGAAAEMTDAFLLPNVHWTQTSIANRDTQLALGQLNTGVWDMIDSNRTGPDANRYLFIPFEASSSGAQRIDTWTGTTTTIVNPGTLGWSRGDASRWTPWGSWITGEENCCGVTDGRLFEVTNPVSTSGPGDVNFVQRNSIIPHVAHEGLAFDNQNSLYFVDENNSGSIYKYISENPIADNGDDFFNAGTTYALKVGAGNNTNVAGSFSWEALDASNTDGRDAANDVFATAFSRPEDLEIKNVGARMELLFFATTGSNSVWTIDLATSEVFQFVTRDTLNIATGEAVGIDLTSPDNLAIDADGNIYIVEDQGTPNADIWRVIDDDNDGVAEFVSRWTALQVTGAEPTGLFFSLADPNVAYVNIQHPSSGNDQTIMITAAVPLPGPLLLLGSAIVTLIKRRRRSSHMRKFFA